MKKLSSRIVFVSLAAAFLAPAPPPLKTSVAIYPITVRGAEESLGPVMTGLLVYELSQSSRIQVIEEEAIRLVLERQGLNESDLCSSTYCQVEIGKLVQAQKMVIGDLMKMGSKYVITLRVIDIQSGVVEKSAKEECNCTEDQLDQLAAQAGWSIRAYFNEPIANSMKRDNVQSSQLVYKSSSLPQTVMNYKMEPQKPESPNSQAQEMINHSWAILSEEISISTLDQAIPLLEKSVTLDSQNGDLLVELSRQYWQRGDLIPANSGKSKENRRFYFENGYNTAVNALRIKESAGSHFWVATNLAAMNEKSLIKGGAIFSELVAHTNWVKQHDKMYFYGATARFWSGAAALMPSFAERLAGINSNEIVFDLDEAIQYEPRYFSNYTYKARLLVSNGKEKEALDILDQVLRQDPKIFPERAAENKLAQEYARKYWREWTKAEYPER